MGADLAKEITYRIYNGNKLTVFTFLLNVF